MKLNLLLLPLLCLSLTAFADTGTETHGPPPPPADTSIGSMLARITFSVDTTGCDKNRKCAEKLKVCTFNQKISVYKTDEGEEELARIASIVLRVPNTTDDVRCRSDFFSNYSYGAELGLVMALNPADQTLQMYYGIWYFGSPRLNVVGDNDLTVSNILQSSVAVPTAPGSFKFENNYHLSHSNNSLGADKDPNRVYVEEISELDNVTLRKLNIKIEFDNLNIEPRK